MYDYGFRIYAARIAKSGPLEDVQIMAGHRYPSSTEKYVRVDVNEQREAVTNLHESIFSD